MTAPVPALLARMALTFALACGIGMLAPTVAHADGFTASPELPTSYDSGAARTGVAHMIALRVSFADQDPQTAFEADDTKEALRQLFTGTAGQGFAATDAVFPYDGVAPYYARSSYGKLAITAEAFDYRARYPQAHYGSEDTLDELYEEALTSLDASGEDLSRFDANEDGRIDGVYLHFANEGREIDDWDSSWWNAQWAYDGDLELDGITPGSFVILHEASNTAEGVQAAIHETGHVLGLPDYYSYVQTAEDNAADLADKRNQAPARPTGADVSLTEVSGDAGLGTFDMMQDSLGDHNGFSKWLLGWFDDDEIVRIVPSPEGVQVICGDERQTVAYDSEDTAEVGSALSALSATGQTSHPRIAVIGNEDAGVFASYYLVEFDAQTGNNVVWYTSDETDPIARVPAGVRVFRVQAALDRDKADFRLSGAEGTKDKQLLELVDPDGDKPHVESIGTAPVAEGATTYGCSLKAGEALSGESGIEGEPLVSSLTSIKVEELTGSDDSAQATLSLTFTRPAQTLPAWAIPAGALAAIAIVLILWRAIRAKRAHGTR